jgi:hypothetical protein
MKIVLELSLEESLVPNLNGVQFSEEPESSFEVLVGDTWSYILPAVGYFVDDALVDAADI